MGGWTAYSKMDQLVVLPVQSVAMASTTFVGQNVGKNQIKRANRGVGAAVVIGLVITTVIIIPIVIFAPFCVRIFNTNPTVIEYGTLFIRYLTPFFILCVFNQILAGALRGSGNTVVPMIIMIVSFVAFRQMYLYIVSNYIANKVLILAMAYPAGWILATVLTVCYYFGVGLKKTEKKNHIESL